MTKKKKTNPDVAVSTPVTTAATPVPTKENAPSTSSTTAVTATPTAINTGSNNNNNNNVSIVMAGPYHILSPPIKKQMMHGHLVPTFRSATALSMLQQPQRLLTVELYTTTAQQQKQQPTADRLLPTTPPPQEEGETNQTSSMQLQDTDRIVLRIFRIAADLNNSPRHLTTTTTDRNYSDSSDHDDAASTTTAPTTKGTTTVSNGNNNSSSTGQNWVEHKVYRMDEVQILKQQTKKDSLEMQLGLGNDTIVRDFRFMTLKPNDHTLSEPMKELQQSQSDTLQNFCQMINLMKGLEQQRAQRQIEQYKSLQQQSVTVDATTNANGRTDTNALQQPSSVVVSTNPTTTEPHRIQILVEIVSATNLPISDLIATDAYVVVRFGTNEIHRTAVISNNLSPIYTLPTGSLFVISYTPEDFFTQGTSGLSFTIKDYDSVGSNDILGNVYVPLQELLNGTGQRIAYPIELDSTAMKANKNSPVLKKNDDKDTATPTTTTVSSPSSTPNTANAAVLDIVNSTKENKLNDVKKSPTLFLRYKAASRDDISFMNEYLIHSKSASKHQKYGIYANETFLSIRCMPYPKSSNMNMLLHRQEKKNQQKEVLVRKNGPLVLYIGPASLQ
jgi:C2 domain